MFTWWINHQPEEATVLFAGIAGGGRRAVNMAEAPGARRASGDMATNAALVVGKATAQAWRQFGLAADPARALAEFARGGGGGPAGPGCQSAPARGTSGRHQLPINPLAGGRGIRAGRGALKPGPSWVEGRACLGQPTDLKIGSRSLLSTSLNVLYPFPLHHFFNVINHSTALHICRCNVRIII